ncbi:hypothetical protein HYDPIDRAFT_136616 [Hydnomerulius pinastri MD-312]|uniref:2Fe-2S ferredoxin-type domain-containing protein n=1 Tax=Hydnomerulius pinastri MD-312 TaxID=994086 RepID=A0A0C9W5S4_9AGAM|nr:hypothetical protein HYDPIDRAFT_136616 [Hydnomerulius pinastri MD-312]
MYSPSRYIPRLTRTTNSLLSARLSASPSSISKCCGLNKTLQSHSHRAFHHNFRVASPLAQRSCGSSGFNWQSCRWDSRRGLHGSSVLQHGSIKRPAPGTGIKLHFQDHKGTPIKTIEASEGDDILSLAHEWDIDLEGACEGSIACSTCHIILPPEQYDLLPEPSDDENDMLDLAFGLTDTSRLGCQVIVTKEMDGMEVRLPSATRNMFVDGKKPTHH